MNMISTGAFLTEMDDSKKQDSPVSKLVAAWEKKNSKTARAGGVSLMALTLAACGSSDDDDVVSYTQAQLDAAKTAATAAAEATAATEAAAAAAAAAAAQTAAVAAATAAANASNAAAAAATPSSSILTVGIDQITGTTGANTISGTVGNAEPTITAGDSIAGGDGADTFAVISTGTTGTVAGVTLTGIETIRVSDTSTGATTINLAGVTGVTNLTSFGSAHTNTASFTNVGAIADMTLSNTSGTGGHTIAYTAATVVGSSDTQNITLDNATNTGVTTVAGVETVAISASGLSSINLAAAAATSVTIAAADATTTTLSNAANTSLATVTASGAGASTIIVDYDLSELSVTGSANNDVIDISAGALGVRDTVDGGDGTDTLLYQATADTTSVAGTAATTVISNVEVLELESDDDAGAGTAADFTIDLDTTEGVTSIVLDANDTENSATFTLNDLNATQMGAISAQVGAGGMTIALDAKDGTGTADSATISATVGSASGTLVVNDSNSDIESVTITATGDADQAVNIGASVAAGSASANGTLTISGGAAGRTMTIGGTALTADTVNLSGIASDTTLTMGTVNATVTGGTGDDDVTFGTTLTNADTIDLGAGNDRIIIDPAASITSAPTVSNVEELEIGATATVSVNLNAVSIPEVVLQAQNAVTNVVTLVNFAGLTTITADSGAANNDDDFNGITLQGTGYAGTADSLTINVTSDTDQSTFGALTLNGLEDVTVAITGSASDFDTTFNNITSTSMNNFTVTSTGYGASSTSTDIVLGSVNDGGSNTMLTFDASGANTGVSGTFADMIASASVTGSGFYDNLSIAGSAANVTLTGGAGNDTLTGADAVDYIYGGAGNDTIDSGDTDTAATASQIFAGAGNDTITIDEADIVTTGTGVDTIFIDTATTNNATPDIVSLNLLDFTAGSAGDVIDFGNGAVGTAIDADYIAFNGGTAEAGLTITTGTNVSATTGLTILTATTAQATDVDTLSAIVAGVNDLAGNGGTTTDILDATMNQDDFLFMIDDGTDTALVHFEGDTTNVAASSSDLDVVAIFRGSETSDFVSANFADFVV